MARRVTGGPVTRLSRLRKAQWSSQAEGATVGYESRMQADILALLELFRGRVPDPETRAGWPSWR